MQTLTRRPGLQRLMWLSVLMLALVLGGCALTVPDSVVVVTSDAPPAQRTQIAQDILNQTAQAPTATPNATATPVPTATPSIPPEELLVQGDRLRINGYYEQAVYAYALVVDADDGDYQAEALFRQGQSAVKEGLFGEAVTALTQLITTFPDYERTPQAYFLRGDAHMGLSMWTEAVQDFQQYLALRPGLIDSYVYERIADAQIALADSDAAVANYLLAVESSRSVVPLLALRERLAQLYLSRGEYSQAIAQYEAILSVAQNTAYRAQITFRLGRTYMDVGRTDEGLATLQALVNNAPEQPQSYDALAILDVNGAIVSAYQRGLAAYHAGNYNAAIEAFNLHTTQVPLINVPPEMYLYLGRAYREIGNPSAAQVAFRTIIDQHAQSDVFGDALLEQGRTLFLNDQIGEAIAHYISMADTYSYLTDDAAEALWRAGYLYGTNDDPTRAAELFERLANAYPNTEQAVSGLLIGASTAYANGNMATAERMYAQLTVLATGDDQAAAYFWLGQIARTSGDEAKAQLAFEAAVTAAPDSYFSARSRDIVSGAVPFAAPLAYDFHGDTPEEIQAAEDWLRVTFAIEQAGPLWPLDGVLADDARLIRGEELWHVAAYGEAETEFFDIVNQMGDERNALASYQLAVHLRSMGAYYPAVFAAANVIRSANTTTLDAPQFIARMRYPVYYLDAVQEVAARYGIDPLLLFSLIRHESLFNTNATAAAGEKGLTQVIPSTAAYIADQLQWPNYQHSQLFKPHVGVEFGAFYLEEQLGRFDGNVIAALAGYNAGPGRASDWLALSGGDPDLFMTTITIDSTRLYVQLIYRNYAIYRALYGG